MIVYLRFRVYPSKYLFPCFSLYILLWKLIWQLLLSMLFSGVDCIELNKSVG